MRWRDLETGQYFTRDPAGFVDGPNLYAYVRQNPWTSFDPLGLETESTIQEKRALGIKEPIQNRGEQDSQRMEAPGDSAKGVKERYDFLRSKRSEIKDARFDNADDAGNYAATVAQELTENGPRKRNGTKVEYGGRIAKSGENEYSVVTPVTNGNDTRVRPLTMEPVPDGSIDVGVYHSHPRGKTTSPDDRKQVVTGERLLRNREHPDSPPFEAALARGETYKSFISESQVYGKIGDPPRPDLLKVRVFTLTPTNTTPRQPQYETIINVQNP